jgi:hypothetical protein
MDLLDRTLLVIIAIVCLLSGHVILSVENQLEKIILQTDMILEMLENDQS